jgi:hypothetical protein
MLQEKNPLPLPGIEPRSPSLDDLKTIIVNSIYSVVRDDIQKFITGIL